MEDGGAAELTGAGRFGKMANGEAGGGMYTKQALRELGVTASTLADAQKRQLDEQGFFTVEDVLTDVELAGMRAEFERMHAAERGRAGTRSTSSRARAGYPTSSTRPRRSTHASRSRRS